MIGPNNADNLIVTGKKFTNVYVDCKNMTVNLTDVKDCTVTESDCNGIFKPSAKVAGR